MAKKNINKKNYFFLIILIIIILDQLTKFMFRKNLDLNESVPIIKNFFHLTLIHNTGAAFGIFRNQGILLMWLSIIVIGFIFFFYDKITEDKHIEFFSALILGGAIGNLIDRLAFGYVIDFLDFRIWPAFNIADSAITIGAISLAIFFLFKK